MCVWAAGMWQEGRGRACRCAGASEGLRRGMGCAVDEEYIAQPAGLRRDCVGERRASARACRCAGANEGLRRGMGCEVGGFNAHSPQQHARTRIIIYVRPARAVKSQPWGRKTPPRMLIAREDFCTRRVCVYISAPAFTLPLHGLRRRPRSDRPPAATVIHNALSTEKLSTSLLAALCKTFSPSRLRTRIYNISFARRPLPGVFAPLWGRGRAVVAPCPAPPSAGWGRAKAKADAPSRSAPHFPRLRPRPCQLMGVAPCAKAEVHKANPAPARALSPRQLVYGRAPAR